MVAIPSMPRPIMPIMCIIPIECIADMLPIIFFMSFIMGMLPIPPPIMPAPPCGAAAEGLGAGAGVAGADFSLSAGWE